MNKRYRYYKKNDKDAIWWADTSENQDGLVVFSFDKKKNYYMFADFPHNLTPKEVEIFCKENPFWAEFFKSRLERWRKSQRSNERDSK